ncbi:MAG: hypothetical protein EOR81_21800 [Mesorhizobium sp.]|nr:MAG: hypothetical protein EOR81_21800 [Mesorhizobium sp.]
MRSGALQRWRDSTPLWPAGHLPLKEGDWQLHWRLQPANAGDWRKQQSRTSPPLRAFDGEMSGRGAKERYRAVYPAPLPPLKSFANK